MADTPHLLPLLPPFTGKTLSPPSPVSRSESPFSGRPSSSSIGPLISEHLPPHAEDVHYPVLVPNMRGLDNLIKLQEDWCTKGLPALTDEIAVFVSATEVTVEPCSSTALNSDTHLSHRLFRKPTTMHQSQKSLAPFHR